MPKAKTGRPVGRPKLYEQQHSVKFTKRQSMIIERLMASEGWNGSDAVRYLLDRAIEAEYANVK